MVTYQHRVHFELVKKIGSGPIAKRFLHYVLCRDDEVILYDLITDALDVSLEKEYLSPTLVITFALAYTCYSMKDIQKYYQDVGEKIKDTAIRKQLERAKKSLVPIAESLYKDKEKNAQNL